MSTLKHQKLRLLWYLTSFLLTIILFYHVFFFFFLIIDLHFLITTVIAKYFNPTEEHLIPRGITTEEAKAEIETSQ